MSTPQHQMTLRNNNYIKRPTRYDQSDWVTEFPCPYNRDTIRCSEWIKKAIENDDALGYKMDEKEARRRCEQALDARLSTDTVRRYAVCRRPAWLAHCARWPAGGQKKTPSI